MQKFVCCFKVVSVAFYEMYLKGGDVFSAGCWYAILLACPSYQTTARVGLGIQATAKNSG
jgi:hypothetical protein